MNYLEFKNISVAHMEELYALAVRLTRSPIEAEDLVHNTYTRALGRWRQLRQPEAVRAWLFQILRGIFINEQRRTTRGPLLQLVESTSGVAGNTSLASDSVGNRDALPRMVGVDRLLATDVEAALELISHESREVVLLADVWGFGYQEIAAILGCPVGTVRSRLHRARTRLAAALEEYAVERGFGRRKGNSTNAPTGGMRSK